MGSAMLAARRKGSVREPRRTAAPCSALLLVLVLLAAGMPGARAQLSKGIVGDHSIDTKGNKFLLRKAYEDTSKQESK